MANIRGTRSPKLELYFLYSMYLSIWSSSLILLNPKPRYSSIFDMTSCLISDFKTARVMGCRLGSWLPQDVMTLCRRQWPSGGDGLICHLYSSRSCLRLMTPILVWLYEPHGHIDKIHGSCNRIWNSQTATRQSFQALNTVSWQGQVVQLTHGRVSLKPQRLASVSQPAEKDMKFTDCDWAALSRQISQSAWWVRKMSVGLTHRQISLVPT